jgi:hypothetical protein
MFDCLGKSAPTPAAPMGGLDIHATELGDTGSRIEDAERHADEATVVVFICEDDGLIGR